MGLIQPGPPTLLVCALRDRHDIEYFIETGTCLGETAYWASQYFSKVLTIEYSRDLYQQCTQKYAHVKNIEFLFGDSRARLMEIVSHLETPGFFWLDAHWSGGATYGEGDECPVVQELEIINRAAHDHFICIDDARLFLSPPPPPHRAEQWPDIAAMLQILTQTRHRRYIVIIEDVIIAVPEVARPVVVRYCQETNARLWEHAHPHRRSILQSLRRRYDALILR